MGTPRPGMNPLPEKLKHRFSNPQDAIQLLLRRRTWEQIVRIAANSEAGYMMAKTFTWVHRNREWLLADDYLRSPPELPSDTGGAESSLLTATLGPQVGLLTQGQEVFAAYHRFVQAGQQLRATVHRFYEQHPWAKEHTRLWQSEERLFCAFAMLTVEAEDMGPKLSPQEMEALALIVGIRFPGEEFEQDPKPNEQRKDAWKAMMRDINESGVLPLLQSIATEHRPPEMVAVMPPASSAQQVVSMLSAPTAPSEPLTTASPERPAITSPEQFEAEGGDKK